MNRKSREHFTKNIFQNIVYVCAAIFAVWVVFAMSGRTHLPVATSFKVSDKAFQKSPTALAKNVLPRSMPTVPTSTVTYEISQSNDATPKILEATIDPPDVHVGNVQKLSVVVEDDAKISSVTAFIETDHKIIPVALHLKGPISDIHPRRYVVDDSNHVILASEAKNIAGNIAYAAGQQYTYEGQWTVEDTHNITYHTTFVAKDVSGRQNSITIAWSDACGIPQGGAWSMSSSCTISSPDGVDNGSATLTSGVLTLNSTFVLNSGNSIKLNGGTIAIGATGKISKTYLWMIDGDSDTYPANSTIYAQDTAPTNGRRRYLLSSSLDCDDTHGYVFQTVSPVGTDADHDGYITGSTQSACVGTSATFNGRTYYHDINNQYTWLDWNSGGLGSGDCDDTNAYVQALDNYYPDNDGDGWPGSTVYTNVCESLHTGASVGCSTDQKRNSSNQCIYYSNANFLDCNDANFYVTQTVNNVLQDNDQDGYTVGGTTSQCAFIVSYRPGGVGPWWYYVKNTSGVITSSWVVNGTQNGTDCNDTQSGLNSSCSFTHQIGEYSSSFTQLQAPTSGNITVHEGNYAQTSFQTKSAPNMEIDICAGKGGCGWTLNWGTSDSSGGFTSGFSGPYGASDDGWWVVQLRVVDTVTSQTWYSQTQNLFICPVGQNWSGAPNTGSCI